MAAAAQRPDFDVAIIGGGPAGLAAAHALSAASRGACRVGVFERVPQLTVRGAGFTIMANGLEAVSAISPRLYGRITSEGHRVLRGRMCTIGGELVSEIAEENHPGRIMEARWGHPWVSWAWSDLQALLAEELPGNVSLHLGQKLEGLRQPGGGDGGSGGPFVELRFEGRDAPLTASAVVGADGYWSRVRREAVGDGPPADMETVFWRARVDDAFLEGFDIPRGSTVSCIGDGMAFLVFPLSGGMTAWVASTPVARLRAAGVAWPPEEQAAPMLSMLAGGQEYTEEARIKGEAAKQRALAAFAPLAPPLRALVGATDPSVIVEHGLFIRRAEEMREEAFGKGCIAVIGDAAHPVRPTGQGLNLALEDTYHLAAHLARAAAAAGGGAGGAAGGWLAGADVAGALAAFRAERLPRVVQVMANAQAQGAAAYRKGGGAAWRGGQVAGGGAEAAAGALPPPPADWDTFLYGVKLQPLADLAAAGDGAGERGAAVAQATAAAK
ncbi:MAG: hypothetical protein J3K34DRAFT_463521 [Monoraphidium minutum]|nr:MAG: hypothetical protein J3K34DRAFT_463521 [Monoraphidium minutum]